MEDCSMNNVQTIFVALTLASAGATQAFAAVGADEAAQLGKTLTPWGAQIAGNKEGTIPAYNGEAIKAPEGFKANSGSWPDPFAEDKPLFRIDAKNMEQYADKLSDGVKALLKKYPDTYYLNVYPSRRRVTYPDWVQKNTVRNAMQCKTVQDGLGVDRACRGGIPFPIPKTGNEVMWNAILSFVGDGSYRVKGNRGWMIDSAGNATLTSEYRSWEERPYWQVNHPNRADTDVAVRYATVQLSPARIAGQASAITDYLDPIKNPRVALGYTPGQRRIKASPEFAYDTPAAQTGGMFFYDEIYLFYGKMDRFDFNLKGKKEMFIPYNTYKTTQHCEAPNELLMKHHVNPECERWELHRTWHVEATVKPGVRHAQSKKAWYWDEDYPSAGLYDSWDQARNLFRSGESLFFFLYDIGVGYAPTTVIYDFSKGGYVFNNESVSAKKGGYVYSAKPVADMDVNFESFVGSILQ